MSGFHGNRIHHRLIDSLIAQCGVTDFVETGTHYGASTKYMASRHPKLPMFTCELNEEYFQEAARRLAVFPNVTVAHESSEKFIARLIDQDDLGKVPLFYADSHWNNFWPLKDEVESIGQLPKFILMVDDFAVPGRPWFETSPGGGGTIGVHRTKPDNRPCAMSLIGEFLPDDCLVGYPTYTKKEAFGNPNAPHLVGYCVVLHGVELPDDIREDPMHEWGGKR